MTGIELETNEFSGHSNGRLFMNLQTKLHKAPSDAINEFVNLIKISPNHHVVVNISSGEILCAFVNKLSACAVGEKSVSTALRNNRAPCKLLTEM